MTSKSAKGFAKLAEPNISARCLPGVAPVHQLPVELLIYIIEQVLQYHKTAKRYYQSLYNLSEVCRHWNLAIQDSPQLWTQVSSDLSATALRKILEQGSNRALDVECRYGTYSRSYERDLHFSGAVGVTADRWRSLVVMFNSHSFQTFVSDMLQQLQVPSLEKLSLEDETSKLDFPYLGSELFGGMAPNLKEVRITRLQCRWSQPTLKGLELIHLVWPYFQSMDVLLDMLRDSPQLQSLRLWGCKCHTGPSKDVPRVFLPKLRDLSLHFFNRVMGPMGPTLENFLNCIRAPLHCALHVDLLFARDQEVIVQFSLQDWLREDICKAVLESLNSLELRFGYNESESTYVHNIRMGYNESSSIPLHCILSGSITIHRSFDSGGLKAHCKILECIDQMIRPFRALGFSTKLNLGGAASYFLADFVAQLGQLPPFTHLELAQYTETTGSGYNIIYEALRGADPHLSFSFSAIRDLVFRDTTPENIKRLIGAALGDHSTSDSLAFATRKKTLDKVEIHIEQRHFEEAEILVKELRDDRRIGEVSLYVTL